MTRQAIRQTVLSWVLLATSSLCVADLVGDWQHSVQTNKLDFIRRHWAQLGDVDLSNERGKTALMAAASQGDTELVRVLLNAGADVNARNQTDGTPLIYAAAAGADETVRLLLANGAHLNHQSVNGWSAVMIAAAKGHAALVELLGRRGADVNLPDIYGWTPLMRAAYNGHGAVVSVLLRQPGIELERLNDHGQTVLHLAVIQGQVAVVRQLLVYGARTDAKDFAGNTPRSISVALGNQQILTLLAQAERF
jgi:ankyrin repeat protein